MTAISCEPILWRLHLAASPQSVYAAWLDPAQHPRYLCERSTRTKRGFRLEFIDGTIEECALEREEPPRRIVLRYFGSRVEVTVEPTDDGSDLTLWVTEVPATDWIEVHAGWLNVLLPFKAHIDHGIDLRNHDTRRTWREHYVDQ
jgi:uncharacterized protein YndB with AHSA1/START domain